MLFLANPYVLFDLAWKLAVVGLLWLIWQELRGRR